MIHKIEALRDWLLKFKVSLRQTFKTRRDRERKLSERARPQASKSKVSVSAVSNPL
jgi:hypothetical protein